MAGLRRPSSICSPEMLIWPFSISRPCLRTCGSGKLRALAVANTNRSDKLPDVPTMAEEGFKGIEMSTWYGISAPAGTPRPVIDKLHGAIAQALKSPAVTEKLTGAGAEITPMSPDEFEAHLIGRCNAHAETDQDGRHDGEMTRGGGGLPYWHGRGPYFFFPPRRRAPVLPSSA
jgi:hypothetical protein